MARKKKPEPGGEPNCPYQQILGPAIFALAHWHDRHSTGKQVSSLIAERDDGPDIYVVSGAARGKFLELFAEEFNRDGAKELERIIFGKELP